MSASPGQLLFAASDLKRQRGWTEGLIASLLGAPDALGANPHGFRPPQRFFRADRVQEVEAGPEFAGRLAEMPASLRQRRELPTRSWPSDAVTRLEWLDDPWRMRLFLAPRRPKAKRLRPALAPAPPATDRFEVLRLFDVRPFVG